MTQLQQLLDEQFLGKTIETIIPLRDAKGKIVPGKFTDVTGKCEYIGPNEALGYPLQVTLNRMPVVVKHISDVKLKDGNQA